MKSREEASDIHVICERCEDGRIADVAEENKGEKVKIKFLSSPQETTSHRNQGPMDAELRCSGCVFCC